MGWINLSAVFLGYALGWFAGRLCERSGATAEQAEVLEQSRRAILIRQDTAELRREAADNLDAIRGMVAEVEECKAAYDEWFKRWNLIGDTEGET